MWQKCSDQALPPDQPMPNATSGVEENVKEFLSFGPLARAHANNLFHL
jgi:hypothetical protein